MQGRVSKILCFPTQATNRERQEYSCFSTFLQNTLKRAPNNVQQNQTKAIQDTSKKEVPIEEKHKNTQKKFSMS